MSYERLWMAVLFRSGVGVPDTRERVEEVVGNVGEDRNGGTREAVVEMGVGCGDEGGARSGANVRGDEEDVHVGPRFVLTGRERRRCRWS